MINIMKKTNIVSKLVILWFVLCNVECGPGIIRECRVCSFGTDYRGTKNSTISGRTCQRWDSQTPHGHTYDRPELFPDRSVVNAENHCRNPVEADFGGLWCYTTDPGVVWEYCDVDKCAGYPECKLSEVGSEYNGHIGITTTGSSCKPWTPTYPEIKGTYCRNPDNKPQGPWCFTDDVHTQWEFCDVPFCKPSPSCVTTPNGADYIGTQSMTRLNVPCQRWDESVPHTSNYTDPTDFPDASLIDAGEFCRNPRGDKSGPWCYTQDDLVEWDYCDLPLCGACRVTDSGTDYAGTVSQTVSGRTCQRWDSQTPHPHNLVDTDRYPDASLQAANNYCRNPDKDTGGPWCFNADPGPEREYCDVPLCQDGQQPVRGVKHVLHIGIDGLHPCFVNTSSPNIINRLVNEGASTLNHGRSVLKTWSLPAWTTTLCSLQQESHGIYNNTWLPQWKGYYNRITPVTGPRVPFPCLSDMLSRQDANIRTSMFFDWPVFQYIGTVGHPGSLNKEYYCDPDTQGGSLQCDINSANNVTAYMRKVTQNAERSYTFLYQVTVDEVGHVLEWCKPEYMDAVTTIDGLVGQVLDVIDELNLQDEVLVILSTDHGGHGNAHGAPFDDDMIIPFMIRGPGIKRGYEIVYTVKLEDLAPTIMYAMGYKPSPYWEGKVMTEIFD